MPILAAIQMVSGPSVAENLAAAADLLARAAADGARLAVLPENFALMGRGEGDKVAVREAEGEGPIQAFLAEQAARHRLWLVGGTIPLRAAGDEGRVRAACLLFDDRGRRVARYDKVHLFDVEVVGGAERYAESATIEPGDRIRRRRYARRAARIGGVLRFALPGAVSRPGGPGHGPSGPARRFHRRHRQGALGNTAPGAGHRESVLRRRLGAGRNPRQRPGNPRR
jgi:hypothetical protein